MTPIKVMNSTLVYDKFQEKIQSEVNLNQTDTTHSEKITDNLPETLGK